MIPPFPATKLQKFNKAQDAYDRIVSIYDESCQIIKNSFDNYAHSKKTDPLLGEATYPYVGIAVEVKNLKVGGNLSYGFVCDPGLYGGTITKPHLYKDYLLEQISLLIERHNIPFYVGYSHTPIPLPFVIDSTSVELSEKQIANIKHTFVQPNLIRLNDDVPNGTWNAKYHIRSISLFEAERIDYSIHRLQHYTGVGIEHFQSFVLLTNYQRYIEEFISFAIQELSNDSGYTQLIGPGNVVMATSENPNMEYTLPKYLPQMPAYHLKRADGQGITFINIGVGPSNAKTITDHIAVLRPHCWIMLGHCAGLRSTQYLGDYVLAHGYVRDDKVLDKDLPPWIPLPPIAEIQVALQKAVQNILKVDCHDLKDRMRTGTIVTTDNRNWELRSRELYENFRQSRAIAVDMESATVAGNGFRFRVPYGTLLCVSDKPIHGEIKLQGMANAFYKERIYQHLLIGLETIKLLRNGGVAELHSRKLRGYDEPPFR